MYVFMQIHTNESAYEHTWILYILHTYTYIITYTNEVIHANIHVQMHVHIYTKCNIINLY